MIIIEQTTIQRVDTWDEARNFLNVFAILLPDYAITNIEAGRPLMVPISESHYVTVKYEPDKN